MKKILLLALMLCGVLSHSFAQKSFVYQAVVRDANQAVVSNQQVAVRISILANDSVCYKELQSVKTNSFGHVSLNVGMGNALAGSFDAIPWSKMNLNIGLEFDLKNGSNFGAMITNKLNAVPYALYAAQYPKAIQADGNTTGSIFSVVNANGDVVFEITENGATVYIDANDSKAAKSAFAVRGRSGAKSTEDILVVNSDGTTVYVNDDESKAAKSAFAVRGRSGAKGGDDSFVVDANGTVVYIDDEDSKAAKSAFAVRGRSGAKSNVTFKIDATGTVIYVNTDESKAAKSAFAVRGRSGAKNTTNERDYFTLSADSTRIYLNDDATFAIAKVDEPQVQLMAVSTDSVTFTVEEVVVTENIATETGEVEIIGLAKDPTFTISSIEIDSLDVNQKQVCITFNYIPCQKVPTLNNISANINCNIVIMPDSTTNSNFIYYTTSYLDPNRNQATLSFGYNIEYAGQYVDEEENISLLIHPILSIGVTDAENYDCQSIEYKLKINGKAGIKQTSTITNGYNQVRIKLETSSLNDAEYSIHYKAASSEDWQSKGLGNENFVFVLTNLTSNTKYKYYTQIEYRNRTFKSDTLEFTTTNEPEYVDFGLPSGTLWATTNVGALNPEDAGDYFAWGETEAKENYSWSTYKHMQDGKSEWNFVNKYQAADGQYNGIWYDSNNNFIGDSIIVLEKEDDAAAQIWGDGWQMPTNEQFNELLRNCYFEWTNDYNNTNTSGFIVYQTKDDSDKGKIVNSNSVINPTGEYGLSDSHIFLPAAHYFVNTEIASYNNYYWLNSLSVSYSDYAKVIYLEQSEIKNDHINRKYGIPIRPVKIHSLTPPIPSEDLNAGVH
ncbi:MAG: hypothetical protein MJ069_00550 [Salinivirgaceae bacterium]|nr:hypothetical protein [Salinivirgaceae bacterium]